MRLVVTRGFQECKTAVGGAYHARALHVGRTRILPTWEVLRPELLRGVITGAPSGWRLKPLHGDLDVDGVWQIHVLKDLRIILLDRAPVDELVLVHLFHRQNDGKSDDEYHRAYATLRNAGYVG